MYKKGPFYIDRRNSENLKGKLFAANKEYKIVTSSPYLVVETEIDNVYAFLDTGFNGSLKNLPSKNLNFKNSKLNFENVIYVGTQALFRFNSLALDYEEKKATFLCFDDNKRIKELGNTVQFSETFKKWDTMPLISFNVILNEKLSDKQSVRKYKLNAFIDTGNPETFLFPENFESGGILENVSKPNCTRCKLNKKNC